MAQNSIENSLIDLERRSLRELWGAFPYSPCREVLQDAGPQFQALVPDLEMWQSDIAEHCSSGKQWLERSNEEVAAAIEQLSMDFYTRFPTYAELRGRIEANGVLAKNMAVYNEYRLELRSLLGDLLISRVREQKCG
jgi:hypothetical protein